MKVAITFESDLEKQVLSRFIDTANDTVEFTITDPGIQRRVALSLRTSPNSDLLSKPTRKAPNRAQFLKERKFRQKQLLERRKSI